MRKLHTLMIALGLTMMLPAFAQTTVGYPNRAVRLVVPYGAGGVSDMMGRVIAQKMTELLGQPMVVENRPGAGGMVGTGFVSRSAPDGYTILFSSLSAYAISPRLVKAPPYDPVNDFTAIGGVAIAPTILTVDAKLPFRSLKELLAYAKANPGKLSYGSSGIGSVGHISAEVLRTSVGVELVHVPYKTAQQAYPDVLAGSIAMVFDALPTAMQHIRSSKMRPIAMMSDRRASLLSDVPTFAEAGYPQATLRLWIGLHGPSNLPGEVVQKLNQTLHKALDAPDLRERFTAAGADPYPTTALELAELVRDDVERLAKMMAAAGIRAE
ncbi:MAG: tripartite tricarboxylate transporter substrate binding protein [Alphaproteobacteria bacterium]|nr:tripartite tricarboxylate transporter substrate binding protein [Alphaproteobacteria bacterium]